MTWYWIDVGSACGGIAIEHGIIVDSAPYFKYLRGWELCDVKGKIIKLEEHHTRDTYD